jgi:hypothetical protein
VFLNFIKTSKEKRNIILNENIIIGKILVPKGTKGVEITNRDKSKHVEFIINGKSIKPDMVCTDGSYLYFIDYKYCE